MPPKSSKKGKGKKKGSTSARKTSPRDNEQSEGRDSADKFANEHDAFHAAQREEERQKSSAAAARLVASLEDSEGDRSPEQRKSPPAQAKRIKSGTKSPKVKKARSPEGSPSPIQEDKPEVQKPKTKNLDVTAANEARDNSSQLSSYRDQTLLSYQMAQLRRRKKQVSEAIAHKSESETDSDDDELEKLYYSSRIKNLDGDEENNPNMIVRVYEARYKIPKNANVGELMNSKSGIYSHDPTKYDRFVEQQKNMGRYKRFVSYSTLVLMAVAFIITIAMLLTHWSYLTTGYYYVARTRQSQLETIDFEEVSVTKVRYFLYRNETEGASDIDDDSNYFIVDNVDQLCEKTEGKSVQQMEDLNRITSIRDNIYSPYMLVSEIYIFIQMLVCAFLALIWFPFKLREYEIPLIMRKARANVFFDFMRIRIMAFVYFLVLVGSLPQLLFLFPNDTCLHTRDEVDFGINWTDYYQFCLSMFNWITSIPIAIYICGSCLKDGFRFAMYPFLVANLVFLFTSSVLAAIVLIFALWRSWSMHVIVIVAFDLFVVLYAIVCNIIYEKMYANKDLLRNETEEVH